MALSQEAIDYQLAHIHEDRTPAFIASVSVVVTLATIGVFLRVAARLWTKVGLAADDYTILVALLMAWGMFVGNYYEGKFGQGKHMIAVSLPDLIQYGKVLWFEDLAYCSTILVIQCSFLLFYRRVFTFQNPRFKLAVIVVGAFALACWVAIFISTLFHCLPIAYNWDKSIPGQCVNPNALFISALALNLFTDILIVLLPIPMIWRIQISRAEKIAVSSAFLLGGFVCIGNLIRLPYLVNVQQEDLTWSLVGGALWSTAEVCIGILSACLPCFRPYLRFVKRSWTTHAESSRSRTDYHEMGNSLVKSQQQWDPPKKDQSIGVESEIRSEGPYAASDVETGKQTSGIGVKRDVFMTSNKA
ncbi:MAG: hypothetical protein M1817_005273 [Caeruleum heppii]|nr:MAG: hypothetical protein M1817_005273 [Caeruleum heppii]